ncbi:FUSC family protein [Peribacillus alkalitolerans]|uniref:FUSC family protein n=1 Tax=Peribacillus alkalitolerans TaxID=1550385 RepID=UPI001F0821D9|nr:aromatic acid exporter family protein [Peribacillus alkalitolerans]
MITLGPRVIKTGLAVVLALYISKWLGLENSVFAAVAATLTIQPSIYRSWKQVIEQVQANALGATIAVASIYLFGNNPIIIGLVMIIVIAVCLKLKMEGAISLTLITVLVMMSSHAYEGILAAANKFVVVLVGMGSAFLVNLIISPPNYQKNYLEKLDSTFRNMSLLLRTAISNELTEKSFQEQWEAFRKDIKKLEDLYNILDEERRKFSKLKPVDAREIVVFKQMLTSLQHGLRLLDLIDSHFFRSKPEKGVVELFDKHLEKLINDHEIIFLKYDGKIKENEPSNDKEYTIASKNFLEKIIGANLIEDYQKLGLVVIASAFYEYSFELERLNQIIEQYSRRKSKME